MENIGALENSYLQDLGVIGNGTGGHVWRKRPTIGVTKLGSITSVSGYTNTSPWDGQLAKVLTNAPKNPTIGITSVSGLEHELRRQELQ